MKQNAQMTRYVALTERYPHLRGYALSIKGAVPHADDADLAEIEEIMRQDILHSTLDWVSAKQFDAVAREAYEVLLAMRTRYVGSYPAQLA
jgi:DnaJ-domain-containing protein 1